MAVTSFIVFVLFLPLILSAFVAVVAYHFFVSWRARLARLEATQVNSGLRNPAGRARRRTLQASVASGEHHGNLRAGQNELPARAAVARTRQNLLPRRSLADAMVQTSFRLLEQSSAPVVDDGSSISAATTSLRSSAPRPDARRSPTPGPSAPRPDARRSPTPGPSAPRPDARWSPTRSTVRNASAGPSAVASRSRPTLPFNMNSPVTRHVRKFKPRAKVNGDSCDLPGQPAPVVTSFYQPDERGDGPIEAPPDLTHDADLSFGDLFYYVMRDDTYQLWLWCAGSNGQPWWKPVHVGYQREDGKWLLVTPQLKVPGWVTWDRFIRVFDVGALVRD